MTTTYGTFDAIPKEDATRLKAEGACQRFSHKKPAQCPRCGYRYTAPDEYRVHLKRCRPLPELRAVSTQLEIFGEDDL